MYGEYIMRNSYPIEQKSAEFAMGGTGGGMMNLPDKRLPNLLQHWTNDTIESMTFHRVEPDNDRYTRGGNTQRFTITSNSSTFVDWSRSSYNFKLALLKTGQAFVPDFTSAAYMQPSDVENFSGISNAAVYGAGAGVGHTVRYVYLNSSASLINKFVYSDRLQGTPIETVENCDIIGKLQTINASSEFHEQDSLSTGDKYLAGVHSFGNDFDLKTDMNTAGLTDEQKITYCVAHPSHIVPFHSAQVFPEVRHQLREIAKKREFQMISISDFFSTSALQSTFHQQLTLDFQLAKYSQAFTDVLATRNALAATWDYTQNCSDYVIYDAYLNLCIVTLKPEPTEIIRTLASTTGWAVDYTQYMTKIQTVESGNNEAIWTFNERKVLNLEKVFMICQPESFYDDNPARPKHEFTLGCSPAKLFGMYNLGYDITRQQIEALYNGITEVSLSHLSKPIIFDNSIIKIMPTDLEQSKMLTQQCFYAPETNILRWDYEGMDADKNYQFQNTSWCLGLDLRKMTGPIKQGLDISADNLTIKIKFGNASHEKLRLTFICCVGAQMNIGSSKTPFVST